MRDTEYVEIVTYMYFAIQINILNMWYIYSKFSSVSYIMHIAV